MLKFDTLMKRCVRNKKKHCVKCILEIWKTENSKSKKKTNKQTKNRDLSDYRFS